MSAEIPVRTLRRRLSNEQLGWQWTFLKIPESKLRPSPFFPPFLPCERLQSGVRA